MNCTRQTSAEGGRRPGPWETSGRALGARLGQLMRERGLNYETLGRLLDMKPQTLNRYVLGQREPKAGVVMEMASRLGVDERWLQGYDVPQVRQAMPGEKMVPVLGTIRAGAPSWPGRTSRAGSPPMCLTPPATSTCGWRGTA